jgi:hypothetical protein
MDYTCGSCKCAKRISACFSSTLRFSPVGRSSENKCEVFIDDKCDASPRQDARQIGGQSTIKSW